MSISKKTVSILMVILALAGFNQLSAEGVFTYEIDGQKFQIPKGYITPYDVPRGGKAESVLLSYSLPDFKILPHPKEIEKRNQLILVGLIRGMSIRSPKGQADFTRLLKEELDRQIYKIKKEHDVHGLEKYNFIPPVPGPGQYPLMKKDDLFIQRDKSNGKVVSYLRCSPPGKDKIPSCSHRFFHRDLIFRITWPIRELENWKEQRDKAIAFIEQFRID